MANGHSADPSDARADGTMPEAVPNGPGAAAVLAAGIGSLALGVFAFAGDASPQIGRAFNIWQPSGPVSGVTTGAVARVAASPGICWAERWSTRDVDLTGVTITALAMLAGGLLLTFPPFMDLLQGG